MLLYKLQKGTAHPSLMSWQAPQHAGPAQFLAGATVEQEVVIMPDPLGGYYSLLMYQSTCSRQVGSCYDATSRGVYGPFVCLSCALGCGTETLPLQGIRT